MVTLEIHNDINKYLLNKVNVIPDYNQVAECMRSVSSKLLILSEEKEINPLIRHCISIGSRFFTSEKKVKLIVSQYLNYLDKFVLVNGDCDITIFKHLTTVTMDLINPYDQTIMTDLVPKEIRIKCESYQINDIPIDIEDFNNWYSNSIQEFYFVTDLQNIATSFRSAIYFLKNKLSTGCKVSEQALKYLIYQNDILPDNLGIFGLADDIYIVERAALKLGCFNIGESLLFEFEGYSSGIKGLLVEEDEKLFSLSLPTRLMLSSMKYLIDKDNKRIVFALPEAGPSALLSILHILLEAPNQPEENFKFPEIGSDLFFPILNGFVQAKYIGEELVGGEKFHVVSFEGKNKSKKFMKADQYKNCILKPRPNSKIFNDQEYLNQKSDQSVSSLFETLKQQKQDFPLIILLTQKNRFFHYFYDIFPFGGSLSEIFHIKYFKRSGSFDEQGNGENKINVFSDAESAREFFINNIEKKPTVICDVADLGESFLEQVSEIFLNRAQNLIFFFSDSEKIALERCRQNDFVFCCHGSAYADFPEINSQFRGKRSIGSFEKKLTTSYLRPNIERINFTSEIVDSFLELSSKVKKASSIAGESYIISKIDLISNLTVSGLFPLEERELNVCSDHIYELIEWLEVLDRDDADDFSRFLDLNLDDILNLPQKRNLLSAIRDHSIEAIFARSKTEEEKLTKYLAMHNLDNVEICKLTALGIKAFTGNILLPVMPTSRKQKQFLCQTKISNKLLINFTLNEAHLFNRIVNLAVKWQTTLESANKQTFKNTNTFKKLPPQQEIDFTKPLNDEIDETDNDLLNSIKNNSKKSLHNSNSNISDMSIACVHQINNENKVIFLPPNAKIICIDEIEEEFLEKSVKSIQYGETVLLRSGGRGDPYDEICSLTHPKEFLDAKSWAVRWKERLRKYSVSNALDYKGLQEHLYDLGLKRGITTIKGWLENSATVAPADPQESIKAIYALPYSGYPASEVQKVLTSIEKVYSMRRDAGDQLLSYLRRESIYNFIEAEEVIIHLPNSEFVMRVVKLGEALGEIEVSTNNLWEIQELGEKL